jgi:DNA-binding GntR family transcriptional regulator
VLIFPQRGASVFTLSAGEVAAICELRRAVESAAIKLAVARNPQACAVDLERIVGERAGAQRRGDQRGYLTLYTSYHGTSSIAAILISATVTTALPARLPRCAPTLRSSRTTRNLSFQEHKRMLAFKSAMPRLPSPFSIFISGVPARLISAEIDDIAAADKEMPEAS